MMAHVTLGNAPTSWGIEKPSDASYPHWSRVLDEMAAAGFAGTELGPYRFLPTDPVELGHELRSRELSLTAGTLMEPFHQLAEKSRILEAAEIICGLLASQGARHLVIIGSLVPEREATAGDSAQARRLVRPDLHTALEMINRVAEIAISHGIGPVLHTHAGTYFEFADELDTLRSSVSAKVGFCVDTGHAIYAGMDPAKLIRDLGSRVAYVHLKDIDPAVLATAKAKRLGFWKAYAQGIFCLLGDGLADFPGIFNALNHSGYRGWLTIEQDASPTAAESPLDKAKANREFIANLIRHTYEDAS